MTPERMTLGGVEVVDVFVDWNLHCANSADLWAMLGEDIDRMEILTSSPEWFEIGDGRWAVFEDDIYVGFEEGESFENRRTYTVEMPMTVVDAEHRVLEPDDDEVTGTFMYTHTLRSALEKRDRVPPTMQVRTRETYNSSRVVQTYEAQRLVDRYINGELGSEYTSYTWYQKEGPGRHSSSWRRFVGDREDYLGDDYEQSAWGSISDRGTENYVDCDVRLVEDDVAGHVPEPVWGGDDE